MMSDFLSFFSQLEHEYSSTGMLPWQASSRRPGKEALRVLVVDDDMRIADTTAEVLETAGFQVETAYTGEAALKTAASFRPDCLLSDVVMRGMNGVELALAFREMHPDSRVVLISGQLGISEVLEDAERRGLEFELLAKPIHPRMLIEQIRKRP
jgi:DNA-binding NtrC family response regulator